MDNLTCPYCGQPLVPGATHPNCYMPVRQLTDSERTAMNRALWRSVKVIDDGYADSAGDSP